MDVVLVIVVIAVVLAGVAALLLFASRGRRAATISPRAPAAAGVSEPASRAVAFNSASEPPASAARALPASTFVSTAAPVMQASIQPVSPAPLFDIDLEQVLGPPPVPDLGWCKQFDPRSGTLDETARLRLIGDLGVVAKDWCVPLLAQAYEEERRPSHRQAALIALAACAHPVSRPTFERALESNDEQERAIAADALTDLEPTPSTKIRRTVERH